MEIMFILFVVVPMIFLFFKERADRKEYDKRMEEKAYEEILQSELNHRVKKYLSGNPDIEWELLEIPINSFESQKQYNERKVKLKKLLYSFSDGLLKNKVYKYIDQLAKYDQKLNDYDIIWRSVVQAEKHLSAMGETRRIDAQLNPETKDGKDFQKASSTISSWKNKLPKLKSDIENKRDYLFDLKKDIRKTKYDLMDSNHI